MLQDPTALDAAATITARFGVTRAQVEECLRIQQLGAAAVHATLTDEASDRLDALRGKPLSEILVARSHVPPAEKEKLDAAFAETAGAGGARFATLTPGDEPAAAAASERRRFGKYEIVRELGRGGMGVVYLAYHPALKAHFAVKVLLAGDDASAESVQRFHREAQAAARLRHPGIVAVHDIGEEEGKTYFAMEYVEGTPLDRVLTDPVAAGLAPATGPRGPAKGLPARVAARMTQEIAEAIQAAHDAGVVHRDLKPSNVIRDGAGRLRVMDFGLAKLVESGEGKGTRTGSLMGTPSYMSPEQAEGRVREVDAQSDVYQLGAIFYDLLTGRPPYVAETPMEIVLDVMRSDPLGPRTLNPKIDRDAETICLTAMAREKSRRYASARALADDCRRWLDGEAIQARPEAGWERGMRWARRRKALTALAALASVALLAAGVAAWRVSSAQAERERERTAREAAERERGQLAEKVLSELREKAGLFLDATLKLRRAGLPMSEGKEYLDKLALAAAEAEEQDPKRPEPHFHLGRMHRALLRFDDALREQEAALAKDPSFAPSLYERALLRIMKYQDRMEVLRTDWRGQEGARLAALGALARGGPGSEAMRALPPDDELAAKDAEAQEHRRVVEQDLQRLESAPADVVAGLAPELLECARGYRLLFFGGPDRREEAIAGLEKALVGGKPNEDAFEAIALTRLQSGQFEAAIETCTRGLERDKGFVPLLRTRALCAWRWGANRHAQGAGFADQHAAAERDYVRASELDPGNAVTRLRLGGLYGDWAEHLMGAAQECEALYEKAEAALGAALEIDPKNADARISRGLERMNRGLVRKDRGEDPLESYRTAEEDLQAVVEANPKAVIAWLWLGCVRADRAVHLSDHGDDPEGAHAQAEAALAHALEMDPSCAFAWITRGISRMNLGIHRFEQGRPPDDLFAQAEADFGRALQIQPDALTWMRRGTLYMDWGEPKDRRGEDPGETFAKAEADFRKALELNPRLAPAWHGLGGLHTNWGCIASTHGQDGASHYARAQEAFDHAIEISPADPRFWEGRGMLWGKQAQERIARGEDPGETIARSVSDYTKAIELDARSANAWLGRARAREGLGFHLRRIAKDAGDLYEKVLQDCSRAIELNPQSAEAWNIRGNSYLNRGLALSNRGADPSESYRSAEKDTGRSVQLNPRDAMAWTFHGMAIQNLAAYEARLGKDGSAAFARAEADFTRAIEINPLLPEAWQSRAMARNNRAYGMAGRGQDPLPTYASAESDYDKVLELNPRLAEAWQRRGALRLDLGVYSTNQNRDPRDWYRKAIEDFSQAIEIAPGSPEAWQMRGAARSNLGFCEGHVGNDPAGLWDGSEGDFAKAVELAPAYADAWMRRGVLNYCRTVWKGATAADKERYLPIAVDAFTHAVSSNPAAFEALWRRGVALVDLERWNDAIADFEAATRINPACAREFTSQLAEARRRAGGGAPAEKPPDLEAPFRRGDQAVSANDYPAARAAYEEGLALLASLAASDRERLLARPSVRGILMKTHYNLACVESQASVGKHGAGAGPPKVSDEEAARLRTKALEHLDAAVEFGWTDAAYLEKDTDLEPLRADPRWAKTMEKAKGAKK